jgi:non-ribosomal peptide synthetase component F
MCGAKYFNGKLTVELAVHFNSNIDIFQVIGMMAIEMIGGVYCSLSSRDPETRLKDLVKQTNSRLILTHSFTKVHLENLLVTVDIDAQIKTDHRDSDIDLERLSNVAATPENIAYIIFTSGSTGVPKGVS